jgi:hypothetical protein
MGSVPEGFVAEPPPLRAASAKVKIRDVREYNLFQLFQGLPLRYPLSIDRVQTGIVQHF